MVPDGRVIRGMSLRRVASVVFALVAILPILLAVYLLTRADLLARTDTQIGLALAVAVAGVGFVVFRRTVDQVARLAQNLQAPAPRGAAAPPAAPVAAEAVAGLGEVTEISQVAGAFHHMLADLRGSTQRLEDLVFKLGALNEMVQLAAHVPRIQDLLALVLQTTMNAVHATIGSIMILDREAQVLRLSAARGISEEVMLQTEVRVGEGIAGRVLELGE